MANEHTPGPWFAYQENKEKRFIICNDVAHDYFRGVPFSATKQMKFIADVRGPNWPGVEQGPETTANARMLAMAPALLEAGIQALSRWPISLRGSALEKAVYEAQGLPVPVIFKPGEFKQIDLAKLARETFAVATPEEWGFLDSAR